MNTAEMKGAVQKMTLEELLVELERLMNAGDDNSEWTRAVRGEVKKRRWLPSEPGVLRWK